MIVTDNFVFIHLPKTGGTFVQNVLFELNKNVSNRYFTYLKRLFTGKYCKSLWIDELMLGSENIWGQHGGVNQIPNKYKGVDCVSIIRNPFDRYCSQYVYKYWQRNPNLSKDISFSSIPNFPELSLTQVMAVYEDYVFQYGEKQGINLTGLGYYSWQFVQYYFKDPDSFLKLYSSINYNLTREEILPYMHDVKFLYQENLNADLYDFLKNKGVNNIDYIKKKSKVLPDGIGRAGNENDWRNELSIEEIEKIKNVDNLIFTIFPNYQISC